MALLKAWFLLLFALQLTSPAYADVPGLINHLDVLGNGTAAAGSVYSAGGTTILGLGNLDNPSNRTGELHLSYTSQVSPSNPYDPNSSLKQTANWTYGAQADLWEKVFLGVDFDSLSDNVELLYTNGIKVTLGIDPLKLSYRHARNQIQYGFKLPFTGPLEFQGAFIFQDTLDAELTFLLGEKDSLSFTGSYSVFSPNVSLFADLLNSYLSALSNFQDTIQSFEQWSMGFHFSHEFNDTWDAGFDAKLAHLIIPANPSVETSLTLGYRFSKQFHVQVGWDYTGDPLYHLSSGALELKYSWDRSGAADEEDQALSRLREKPQSGIRENLP